MFKEVAIYGRGTRLRHKVLIWAGVFADRRFPAVAPPSPDPRFCIPFALLLIPNH